MSLNNQVCHTDPLGVPIPKKCPPSFLSLPSSTSRLSSGAPPSTDASLGSMWQALLATKEQHLVQVQLLMMVLTW